MFKFGSKNDINVECKCTVRLLDDSEVLQCVFHRDQKGFHLIDYVCDQLNLIEKDYFGLRYVDETKQRHWLDPSRSIVKQIKGMSPIIFCFRVKFYPPDPHKLKEEITKYQIFLQLRRDLLHGRLYCSQTDAALLAAFIIQSELGDYDPDEHSENYIADFKLLLKQTQKIEEKIQEIHQIQLKGQVPSVAESNFLRKACLLDTYGVDPHPVKDQKGNQLYLGINHAGILTFQGSRKTHHFKWQDVQKLDYESKIFIIHLMFNEDSRTKKKHTIGFKCPSTAACRHLWRCAVEQRIFFTLSSSAEAPSVVTGGSFFSRSSRFRYSGRVEKEILESSSVKREPPEFSRISSRSLSFRLKSGALTSSQSSSQDGESGFTTLPRTKHSTPILVVDSLDEEPMGEGANTGGSDKGYHPSCLSYPDSGLTTVEEGLEPHSSSPYARISSSGHHLMADEGYRDSINVDHVASSKSFGNALGNNVYDGSVDHHLQQQQQHYHHHTTQSSLSPTSTGASTPSEVQSTGFIPLFSSQQPYGPGTSPSKRKKSTFRLLVPTFFFAVFFLSCVIVVILESDSELLSDVRRMPELILLRREYYEPFKEFVKKAIGMVLPGSG